MTARTDLFLGWLEYRQDKYGSARERFGTALEVARGKRDDWLLGNLYNGLGLLESAPKPSRNPSRAFAPL